MSDHESEITRLTAEVERLTEELDTWKSVFPDIAPASVLPDRSLLEAENERLQAEVERLNSELTDAYTDLNSARQDNGSFTTEFKRLTAEVERLNKENALGGVIHSLFGTFLTPERYDCLAAKNARIEQLEAALAWIDQQRYTGRRTINPANGYDHAIALNEKLMAVMDVAHAALAQEKPND